MTFDVTKGLYWYTRMPDGKWGVFWSHPTLGDWHRMVASFSLENRAETYCCVENDCLELDETRPDVTVDSPPALLAPPSRIAREPAPNRANLQQFAEQFLQELPDLFLAHPKGLTTDFLRERYGASYAAAAEAMKWVHHIGAGQWIYRRGTSHRKTLLPPDAIVEEHDLTENQERVFDAMREMADQFGCISRRYRDIAAQARIGLGSLSPALQALQKKGYIMLAKPAASNGTAPSVYQILDKHKDDDGRSSQEQAADGETVGHSGLSAVRSARP